MGIYYYCYYYFEKRNLKMNFYVKHGKNTVWLIIIQYINNNETEIKKTLMKCILNICKNIFFIKKISSKKTKHNQTDN